MIYIPQQDLAIAHIVKTGGTWVRNALNQSGVKVTYPALDRLPAGAEFRHALPSFWSRLPAYRVAFIREPVAWYVSLWRWCDAEKRKQAKKYSWHPARAVLRYWCLDFNEFARLCLEHQPGFYARMLWLYCGDVGAEWPTHIGRQESLRSDCRKIMRAAGITLDVTLADQHVSTRGLPMVKRSVRDGIQAMERPVYERWY